MLTPDTETRRVFTEKPPADGGRRAIMVLDHRQIPLSGVRKNEAVKALVAAQQTRDARNRLNLR